MSNISTQDKIVAAVVILCGLVFFGLLASKCNPLDSLSHAKPNTLDSNKTKSTEVTLENTGDIAKLEVQLTELNKELEELKQKNESLAATLNKQSLDDTASVEKASETKNQNNNTQNDSNTNTPKQASQAHEELLTKNAELKSNLANTELKVKRLTAQTEELSTALKHISSVIQPKNNESLSGAASRLIDQSKETTTSLSTTQAELKELKKKYIQLESQTPEAQDEVLQKQLAELKKRENDAQTKVKILEAKLAQKEAEADHASKLILAARKLQASIQAKNEQIQALNARISQLNAISNTFVDSTEALPQTAKALFTDLKKLEGKSQAEIEKVYQALKTNHKASSLGKITFASGKAGISPPDLEKIKEIASSSNDNAYFLVVGFADNSGNTTSNKTLSSKRSTNVAKELNKQKKGFQAAQAVYLGQTTRFGEPEKNRVVEIWGIN